MTALDRRMQNLEDSSVFVCFCDIAAGQGPMGEGHSLDSWLMCAGSDGTGEKLFLYTDTLYSVLLTANWSQKKLPTPLSLILRIWTTPKAHNPCLPKFK